MVLMDLLLPEMDGLCLLKRMQSMKKPPIAICLSEFYSALCVDAARRSGASYYIFKPATLESIASILREYAELSRESVQRAQFKQEALEEDEYILRIHRELNDLGFSPKYIGSGYLAECIALALKSPMLMQNLEQGVYRELSVRQQRLRQRASSATFAPPLPRPTPTAASPPSSAGRPPTGNASNSSSAG